MEVVEVVTSAEGDRMAAMVLLVVREVERRQLGLLVHRGAPERTGIYVDRDVADVVYGRA